MNYKFYGSWVTTIEEGGWELVGDGIGRGMCVSVVVL